MCYNKCINFTFQLFGLFNLITNLSEGRSLQITLKDIKKIACAITKNVYIVILVEHFTSRNRLFVGFFIIR